MDDYLLTLLSTHCQATLFAYKPASLFTVCKKYIINTTNFFHSFYNIIKPFYCSYIILKEDNFHYYILLYSPELLENVFCSKYYKTALLNKNYNIGPNCVLINLTKLKEHYHNYFFQSEPFPHEIGIFLGYPLNDMDEFVKQKGKNALITGYWKAYENVEETRKLFHFYDTLKDYCLYFLTYLYYNVYNE